MPHGWTSGRRDMEVLWSSSAAYSFAILAGDGQQLRAAHRPLGGAAALVADANGIGRLGMLR
jgi:hypothetical protein